MPSTRTKRGPGFSLIELLVVIAIVALLIGILLPSLGSARLAAKTVACGSKLQQIGVGTSMYLSDFRDALPQVLVDTGSGPAPVGSLFAGKKGMVPFFGINEYGAERRPLNPYLGVGAAIPDTAAAIQEVTEFESPLDRGADRTGLPIPGLDSTESMYDFVGASYTLNDHAPDLDPARDAVPTLVPARGGRMPRVADPSRTVLIATHTLYNFDNGDDRRMLWFDGPLGRGKVEANILFVDLHVDLRQPVRRPDDTATEVGYTFLPDPEWATARGGVR
ncbi:MAG: type II secretion system protein [Phycisphaerales bacterium]